MSKIWLFEPNMTRKIALGKKRFSELKVGNLLEEVFYENKRFTGYAKALSLKAFFANVMLL